MNSIIHKVAAAMVSAAMVISSFAPLIAVPAIAFAAPSSSTLTLTDIGDGHGSHDPSSTFACDATSLTNPITISGNGTGSAAPGLIEQYHVSVDWGDGSEDIGLGSFTPDSGHGDFAFTFTSPAHTYDTLGAHDIIVKLYHQNDNGNDNQAEQTISIETCQPIPPPPQGQTKLGLLKTVVGGTAVASEFTLTATGPTSFSGQGPLAVSSSGFLPGTYTLSESGPLGYTASNWFCAKSNGTHSTGNSITLAEGDVAKCSITNTSTTDTPPIVCDANQHLVGDECVPNETPVCDPQINLIANGGFEAPDVATNTYEIIPFTDALLKWVGEWASPQTSGRFGLEIQDHIAGTPASGEQLAELDGDHPTNIWQDIATIPGDSYNVAFKYSPRPGRDAADNQIEFRVGGTLVGAILSGDATANGDTVWTSQARSFVATSSSTRVGFYDTGTDNSLGGYLDDVSVTCSPAVEPPSCERGEHLDNTNHCVPNEPPTCPAGQHFNDANVCVPNELPASPTLTLVKHSVGGDGTFHFTLTGVTTASPVLHTEDGWATTTINLNEGISLLGEVTQEGWILTNSNCEYEGLSIGNDVVGHEQIEVEGDDHVTCTFTNAKDAAPPVFGCTDSEAINYEPSATANNGSCIYSVLGCTNPAATNYNDAATQDDDSCVFASNPAVLGCTNSSASNFNSAATQDDGSCTTGGGGHHGGGGGGGCAAGTHFNPQTAKCDPNGQVLGASSSSNPKGQVLGVSCGLYMDQHLKKGSGKNKPDQVTKLQTFLTTNGFGTFNPTGYFGPLTEAAVKAFQTKYGNQILKPWNLKSPTGLAYLTTIRQLNQLECPDLTIPEPELVPWNLNPLAQ